MIDKQEQNNATYSVNDENNARPKAEKNKHNGSHSGGHANLSVKDIIIFVAYVILLTITIIFIILEQINGQTEDSWHVLFSIIGAFTILTLFFACMFEFSYEYNLLFAVPNSFIRHKEQRIREILKQIMFAVLNAQNKDLSEHDEEIVRRELLLIDKNTDYALSAMNVIETRNSGLFSIEDARRKLKELVFKSNIIQDISKTPQANLTPGLQYYIRFPDLMYDDHSRDLVTNIASTYIANLYDENDDEALLKLPEAGPSFISSRVLSNLDAIVTPNNGNYLLGYDISRLLRKDHIKVITPEKIIDKNAYEGIIRSTKPNPSVLFVHDVLATGKQIIQSIDSLKDACPNIHIMGVLTLIYRTDGNSERYLKERDVALFPLLRLAETDIKKELNDLPE